MTTTTDDVQNSTPCPIKGGVWRELAKQTAKDRKAVMRELGSNSIDAIRMRMLSMRHGTDGAGSSINLQVKPFRS